MGRFRRRFRAWKRTRRGGRYLFATNPSCIAIVFTFFLGTRRIEGLDSGFPSQGPCVLARRSESQAREFFPRVACVRFVFRTRRFLLFGFIDEDRDASPRREKEGSLRASFHRNLRKDVLVLEGNLEGIRPHMQDPLPDPSSFKVQGECSLPLHQERKKRSKSDRMELARQPRWCTSDKTKKIVIQIPSCSFPGTSG